MSVSLAGKSERHEVCQHIIFSEQLCKKTTKNFRLLCVLSVSLVVGVFVLIVGCILFDSIPEIPIEQRERETPLWNYILTAYGIIVFQFDIHPTILTIQVDMLQKKKLSKALLAGFLGE